MYVVYIWIENASRVATWKYSSANPYKGIFFHALSSLDTPKYVSKLYPLALSVL